MDTKTLGASFIVLLLPACQPVGQWTSYSEEQGETLSSQETALFNAIEQGDEKEVDKLLSAGVSVNTVDPLSGGTPLQLACFYNQVAIVKQLAGTWKADLDLAPGISQPALFRAVNDGKCDVVSCLLEQGAKINATFDGRTVLHTAILRGHWGLAKLLIEHKADVDVQNTSKLSALRLAISAGSPRMHGDSKELQEVIKLMIPRSTKINKMSNSYPITLLKRATEYGWVDIVQLLLERGADPSLQAPNGGTPLYTAVHKNNLELVKVLLSGKADINQKAIKGLYPIHVAAAEGYTEMARYLLDQGAKVNVCCDRENTPLYYAASNGELETSKVLLEHKANPSQFCRQTSIVQDVIVNGHLNILKELMKRGADIHEPCSKEGQYPICMAASIGNPSIVQFLMDQGVDTEVKGPLGTPLDTAKKCQGRLNMPLDPGEGLFKEVIQLLKNKQKEVRKKKKERNKAALLERIKNRKRRGGSRHR